VTETVCSDCEGALALVTADGDLPGADLDLMCVVCGAALSLGGLLLGEADAWDEQRGAA
jgi:hypothetical protein